MAHRPRILFLARRYPPTIGGIQTHCHALYTRLANQAQVRLVALGRQSLLHLIWFLPYCFAVAFWAVLGRRVDAVYFADGVAASLAPLLPSFGSGAIRHHRLWPRNDLQKSPRARADALGSPRLRQGRRHQRTQPPHYRCQRRPRGQVGNSLSRG